MGGVSATEQRYSQNMSSTGLHSTNYYRQSEQPVQRTMSLSSRTLRSHNQPQRAMSMSMRSNSLKNNQRYSLQPGARTISINNSSVKQPRTGSRTNSLNMTSHNYANQPVLSRTASRTNSRSNSLTSSIAHTKIIKTTKETDMEGRTRSITTTTIERRGDMKIVRTTVIQPSDAIDEEAELEELAEMENEFDNFDDGTGHPGNEFNEFDDGYDGGNLIEKHSMQANTAALAANAAAAALGLGVQQHSPPQQYQSVKYQYPTKSPQLQSPTQLHSPKMVRRSQESPVTSPIRKSDVRFQHEDRDYLNGPNRIQIAETDADYIDESINQNASPVCYNDFDNEVQQANMTPTDSFHEKTQNRLSQIQEVTEVYDTSRDNEIYQAISKQKPEEKSVTTKDSLRSPFSGFNSIQPPQLAAHATNSTLNSEDERYEEAQEVILSDPPAVTDINYSPFTRHSYRKLAAPLVANTLPTPPSSGFANTEYSRKQQDVDSFVSENQPRKLKSALKNSSSSVVSSSNGDHQNRVFIKENKPSPRLPQLVTKPPAQNMDEMYAIAMKAAEKKVYGDRLSQAYIEPPVKEDIDDATLENTLKNVNSNTAEQQGPGSGAPYQSNASGMNFKLHSLRDLKDVKRVENQTSGRKKKLFKNVQRAQKKQWEEERRAIADSYNPITEKISENVNKRVSRMPVDPNVERKIFDEEKHRLQQQNQQPLQPQVNPIEQSETTKIEQTPAKSKFGFFKRGNKKKLDSNAYEHKKTSSVVSQNSSPSVKSSSKRRFFSFGNKRDQTGATAAVTATTEVAAPTGAAAAAAATKSVSQMSEIVPSANAEANVVYDERIAASPYATIAENGDMHTIPENESVQHELVSRVDTPVEVPPADTAATTTDSSKEEPALLQPPESNIISQEELYTDAMTGFEPTIAGQTPVNHAEQSFVKYNQPISQVPENTVEHVDSKKETHTDGKTGSKLLRFFNL